MQLNGKRRDKDERHAAQPAAGLFHAAVGRARARIQIRLCQRRSSRTRYGQWPRGLSEVPMAPDAAFLNWLKSQQIAFHKRRQKEARRAA